MQLGLSAAYLRGVDPPRSPFHPNQHIVAVFLGYVLGFGVPIMGGSNLLKYAVLKGV